MNDASKRGVLSLGLCDLPPEERKKLWKAPIAGFFVFFGLSAGVLGLVLWFVG